jgi:peptidoglycan/LPS O-acetylase OafA/YrhL
MANDRKRDGGQRPLVRSDTHLPTLDGLRGIAILLVLAIHFTVMRPLVRIDAVVFSLARTGWVGVDLFFVLSGFLITGILYRTREVPRSLRTFYARRFLRIFPLYYGFLLVLFAIGPLLVPGSDWLETVGSRQLWHWAYLSNVLAALEGWDAVPHLGHLWSLAIEEQFYLLWPLAVLTLSRRRLIQLCGGLLVASFIARVTLLATGASPIAVYALTFTRWDGLVVGALVALAGRSAIWSGRMLRWSGPVAGAGVLALAAMVWAEPYRSHYGLAMQTVGYPILAVVFGALLVRVLAATAGSASERLMTAPALRFLGRYSYGIYIVHAPLAGLLMSRGISPALLPRLWGSALPGQILFWLAATAVTVAVAVPIWHLWERPFLSMKRFFTYERRATVSAPGAASVQAAPIANAG